MLHGQAGGGHVRHVRLVQLVHAREPVFVYVYVCLVCMHVVCMSFMPHSICMYVLHAAQLVHAREPVFVHVYVCLTYA